MFRDQQSTSAVVRRCGFTPGNRYRRCFLAILLRCNHFGVDLDSLLWQISIRFFVLVRISIGVDVVPGSLGVGVALSTDGRGRQHSSSSTATKFVVPVHSMPLLQQCGFS